MRNLKIKSQKINFTIKFLIVLIIQFVLNLVLAKKYKSKKLMEFFLKEKNFISKQKLIQIQNLEDKTLSFLKMKTMQQLNLVIY